LRMQIYFYSFQLPGWVRSFAGTEKSQNNEDVEINNN